MYAALTPLTGLARTRRQPFGLLGEAGVGRAQGVRLAQPFPGLYIGVE